MSAKCPICGETDPRPASLCLAQLTTAGAERAKPCQYSVEGQERTRQAMVAHSNRIWAEIEADRAKRALTAEEQRRTMDALRAGAEHVYDIGEGTHEGA